VEVEAQDSLARVLAISGLATGILATLIALLTFLRDRPKLSVSGLAAGDEEDRRVWYEVTVTNHGRQPVSVINAGLRFQIAEGPPPNALIRLVNQVRGEPGMIYVSFIGGPVLFSPGEVHNFQRAHEELSEVLLEGIDEAVPFAEDSRGRVVTAGSVGLGPRNVYREEDD
jgi:hypothetical protein